MYTTESLMDMLFAQVDRRYFLKKIDEHVTIDDDTVATSDFNVVTIVDNVLTKYGDANPYSLKEAFMRLYLRDYPHQSAALFKYATIANGTYGSIPFSSLCKLLDIDLKTVKKNLSYFYELTLNERFTYLGCGGIGTNLFQILHHFEKVTGFSKSFKSRSDLNSIRPLIFDPDEFAFHNMFRLYDHGLLKNHDITNIRFKSFTDNPRTKFSKVAYTSQNSCNDKLPDEELKELVMNVNGSFVGGPDIRTRKMLFERNIPLTLTGHSGYDIAIVQNIAMTGTEIETYGSINVPLFLLNMIKMVEGYLDFCKKVATNEYDLRTMKDVLIFKFNSLDFLRNKFNTYEENRNEDSDVVIFDLDGNKYRIYLK